MHNDRHTGNDEATLRLVVESAPSALIMADARGNIILANAQAEQLFGYSREELVGRSIEMLVPERYRAPHPGQRAAFFADPSKRAMGAGRDLHGLRKDGSEVPVEIGLTPIRTPQGLHVLAALIDISERRRLERERSESELRYAELVNQALEGILVRKPSGEFLFVNDAFCRMLGYARVELLRMGIRDVVHPEDAETIAQVQQLKSGGSLRLEKRMGRKDGQVLHVQVSARRLANGDIQSTVQDVTDSRRAEERFRAMVEGSPSAMLMVNAEGSILLVNPQTEKLFGYRQEELLGKPVEMLIPVGMRGHHPALRAGFHRTPQTRTMGKGRELFALHKDGSPLPVEIGLNPVTTHEGQCVMASVIDITERLQAQEALRSLPKQLLDAQETERRRIARELHDEVGQALTACQIRLQDLEAQLRGATGAQEVAEISAMMATLLQQVRQLSLDLRPTVLDDLGLVSAIRWFMRERVPQGYIQVELDVPLTLPRPPVSIETAMFRAFQSAVTNVLRHADARNIRVSLSFERPRLTLEVRDDGKGFDLELARQRARQGGSLGLLGMEEWIRLSGGEFKIESTPGRGTRVRVTVTLPAHPPDAIQPAPKGG